MTTLNYALDDLVHDLEALLEDQADQKKIFDTGSSYLAKLVQNPDAVPAQFRAPTGTGPRPNHGTYLLYQGESGLSVTAVVWGPGDHASPHDHRTWGMIGVLANALTETRFRRVDDRSQDGFAQLEQDRRSLVKPGEVSLLIPEVDEIHQMDNFTDRPTIEVHVYGTDLRGLNRSRFDLETEKISPFLTTRYDNC